MSRICVTILVGASLALGVNQSASADYNWTGFYIGGNIGYGWGRSDNTFGDTLDTGITASLGAGTTNVNGVIGGLQAGYNWQTGFIALGLETDIQASGQTGNGVAAPPAFTCDPGCTVTHTEKLTWFGTTRGRVGLALDRWLVYATGGVAYGGVKSSDFINIPNTPLPITATFGGSSTRGGWTVGAGLEGALTGNWTARAEYLYMDLGTANFSTRTPGGLWLPGTFTDSMRLRNNLVRVGANYRF